MLRKVNFACPELASKYGDQIELNASSWKQILSLMEANFHNFRKSIIDGSYAIVRGRSLDDYDESLTENDLCINYETGNWEWFIVSEAVGAKSGFGAFLMGVVLIGTAFAMPASIGVLGMTLTDTLVFQIGFGLMMGGIVGMLTPVPDASGYSNEAVDEKASWVYNGGVNNIEQGGIVPIVLGQCYAGSVLIASSVNVMEKTGGGEADTWTIGDFESETF